MGEKGYAQYEGAEGEAHEAQNPPGVVALGRPEHDTLFEIASNPVSDEPPLARAKQEKTETLEDPSALMPELDRILGVHVDRGQMAEATRESPTITTRPIMAMKK